VWARTQGGLDLDGHAVGNGKGAQRDEHTSSPV